MEEEAVDMAIEEEPMHKFPVTFSLSYPSTTAAKNPYDWASGEKVKESAQILGNVRNMIQIQRRLIPQVQNSQRCGVFLVTSLHALF